MTYVYRLKNRLNDKMYYAYYTEKSNIVDSGILADGFFDSDSLYSIVELYNLTGKSNIQLNILEQFETESDAITRLNELILVSCMNI